MMENIFTTLDLFLTWVFRTSGQASILILMVLAVQWLFRRQLSPRWHYSLWFLVVIRMVMPFPPESSLSIFNLNRMVPKYEWVPTTQSSVAKTTATANEDEPATIGKSNKVIEKNSSLPSSLEQREEQKKNQNQIFFSNLKKLFLILWSIGIVVLLARLLWENRRLSSYVIRQRPVTDPSLLNLLEDCKNEMKLHTPVSIVATPQINSPMLLGFVRPRLLLPEKMVATFSSEEIRYIFLHELGHIKRHDIAMNWLTSSLQILHWFNPLVWFAFSRMRADREQACDALVLACVKDKENINYGETILKLLENFTKHSSLPSLAGILEDKNQMKTRINLIASFSKKARQRSVWAVVLLLCLGVMGLTEAKDRNNRASTNQAKKKSNATSVSNKVITIWKVGSPQENDLPKALIPKDLAMAAHKIGCDLKIQVFPAKDFDQKLIAATEENLEPDIIAINNYGIITGIQTPKGNLKGIQSDEKIQKSLVSVAESLNSLEENGGWEFLLSTSRNYDAARQLALREPETPSLPDTFENLTFNEINNLKEAATSASIAYLNGDLDVIQKMSAAFYLGDGRLFKTPKHTNSSKVLKIYGNSKLAFVSTVNSFESVTDFTGSIPPADLGHMSLLVVFVKNAGQWKMLTITNDPISLKGLRIAIPSLSKLLKNGDVSYPLQPAVLITNGYPKPPEGERFGYFQWKPSDSSNIVCEVAEFDYGCASRLFFLFQRSSPNFVSSGNLWSADQWHWRIWSISDSGDIALSEAKTFQH